MASAPDKFQQVRELLEQLDHQTSAEMENRRRTPRLPIRMALRVSLLTGAAPTKVDIFTRNFSMAGFGFVSRRLFRIEERVAILLKFPNSVPKLILARVTFARYVRSGMHEAGTEFVECIANPKNPEAYPSHWTHHAARRS